MRAVPLLLCSAMLASCASGPPSEARQRFIASEEARLAAVLDGKVAGKKRSCISSRDTAGPESFGDTTLLFRAGRNLYYRNEVRGGSCGKIGQWNALVTIRYGSSDLCSGDIAYGADLATGIESSRCVLGDFVPYRTPKG